MLEKFDKDHLFFFRFGGVVNIRLAVKRYRWKSVKRRLAIGQSKARVPNISLLNPSWICRQFTLLKFFFFTRRGVKKYKKLHY